MNDFTKEQLLEILWAVDYVRERTTNRSDAMRRLQGNILSMIDNYCEHEWDNRCTHSWDNGCCGGDLGDIKCVTCKRKLNDN